jgi:hypothetical protein
MAVPDFPNYGRDFEAKLAWANVQTQRLEQCLAIWRGLGGYGVVFEPQPNGRQHVMRLKAGIPPHAASLTLGDALHAMRSGLDQLAYALAEAGKGGPLNPKEAKDVEFPIFGERAMTAREEAGRIGLMPDGARTAIKRLQPHERGAGYVDDPLWHLHDLANLDRHRLLHTTIAVFGGLGIGGDNLHVISMRIYYVGPDLKDGAEIGICEVGPIDPGRPMQMNVTPEPQIVFKEGPRRNHPVVATLQSILAHINTNVVPELVGYL